MALDGRRGEPYTPGTIDTGQGRETSDQHRLSHPAGRTRHRVVRTSRRPVRTRHRVVRTSSTYVEGAP